MQQMLKLVDFLFDTKNGTTEPRILTEGFRECAGFFLASLLISGGVQYATRTLGRQDVVITWDGTQPQIDAANNRGILPPGTTLRLSGSVSDATNTAVRWRLESGQNSGGLKDAQAHNLLTIDDAGRLTAAKDMKWMDTNGEHEIGLPLLFDIVAAGAENPALSASKAMELKAAPAAPPPAAPDNTKENTKKQDKKEDKK
jgi:hypothetical protein